MTRRRRGRAPAFDVLVYAPWAAELVGGPVVEAGGAGAEVQLVKVAAGLAERGLRVGVVVLGEAARLPRTAAGVHVLVQPPRRRGHGVVARALLAAGAVRAMTRVRPRVVIQRNAGPTTAAAALAARLRGAEFVYSSSSVVDFDFGAFEARSVNVALYEWGVRRAAAIVVQTGEQAGLCRRRFDRDPVVIPSIGDPPRRRTRPPEAFLWVGRLDAIKRPDAYVALARAVPEARFWMVAPWDAEGASGPAADVAAAAERLENLELLAPRPREEIGELVERSVAVVSTSEREGMPNVLLEGWARGVPALVLSFDPDGVVARKDLGAFAGGDPARFEAQARGLWRDRSDQRALAERCLAHVREEHDRDQVIGRWYDLVRRG